MDKLIEDYLKSAKTVIPIPNPAFDPAKYRPDLIGVQGNETKQIIEDDKVGIEDQLLDLNMDPHETTHFTKDPKYKEKLTDLRKSFETEWFPGY